MKVFHLLLVLHWCLLVPVGGLRAESQAGLQGTAQTTIIEIVNRYEHDHAKARSELRSLLDHLLGDSSAAMSASTAKAVEKIAVLAYRWGDPELSHKAWAAVTGHLQLSLPEEHPQLQRARIELAYVMSLVGQQSKALVLAEVAIRHLQSVLHTDHADLTRARFVLAEAYSNNEQFKEARDLLLRVIADRVDLLEPDDAKILMPQLALACVHAFLGDMDGMTPKNGPVVMRVRSVGG